METAEVAVPSEKDKEELRALAGRLAETIKQARLDAGYKTTSDLAHEKGLKRTTLNKWEKPEKCNPTVGALHLFSKAIDTDLANLFSAFGDQKKLRQFKAVDKQLRDDIVAFLGNSHLRHELREFIKFTKAREARLR